MGFAFTINKNNVNITSVHPAFEFGEVESIFLDIVEKNLEGLENLSPSLNDRIARLLAKSKSKKILKLKNREEQDLLLNKIFSCKEPNYSPDNKRIVYKINIENINSKFH